MASVRDGLHGAALPLPGPRDQPLRDHAPERRITSMVPHPSAVARITLARATCFWAAWRSRAIASKRRRSSGVTVISIPALIPRAFGLSGSIWTRLMERITRGASEEVAPLPAATNPCPGQRHPGSRDQRGENSEPGETLTKATALTPRQQIFKGGGSDRPTTQTALTEYSP
jgi:hypothetical protein